MPPRPNPRRRDALDAINKWVKDLKLDYYLERLDDLRTSLPTGTLDVTALVKGDATQEWVIIKAKELVGKLPYGVHVTGCYKEDCPRVFAMIMPYED